MHKLVLYIICILIFLSAMKSLPLYAEILTDSKYIEGEVFVLLKLKPEEHELASTNQTLFSTMITRKAQAFADSAGLRIIALMQCLSDTSGKIFIHMSSDVLSTKELIENLSKGQDVLSVTPNYIRNLIPPSKKQ